MPDQTDPNPSLNLVGPQVGLNYSFSAARCPHLVGETDSLLGIESGDVTSVPTRILDYEPPDENILVIKRSLFDQLWQFPGT